MTAGVSLIPGKTGAHRAPLQYAMTIFQHTVSQNRMDYNLSEWLNLFIRWVHVFAGILWVGQTFFFTWMDRTLEREKSMWLDRKSTRLNSSHVAISYAVFCLKK